MKMVKNQITYRLKQDVWNLIDNEISILLRDKINYQLYYSLSIDTNYKVYEGILLPINEKVWDLRNKVLNVIR